MFLPGFKHGVCSFGAVWQPDRCTAQGAQDSQIIFWITRSLRCTMVTRS